MNIKQIRKDLEDGIIVSKATLLTLAKMADSMQNLLELIDNEDFNYPADVGNLLRKIDNA